MSEKQAFDEKVELKRLQSEFAVQLKPLMAITAVKSSSPTALGSLEKAISALPSPEILAASFEELSRNLLAFVAEAKAKRVETFGRLEKQFIETAQAAGQQVREAAQGWRIGALELQVDRERSMIAFSYNREELVPMTPVASLQDVRDLHTKAAKMLTTAALPDEVLTASFRDAYESLVRERTRARKVNANLVPILDFYREVRASLVRCELRGQRPEKRLKYADLPRWAFIYNTDRYRALGSAVPDRLTLQTGSQQEAAKGQGMLFNGLDACEDRKMMCYVVAVRG